MVQRAFHPEGAPCHIVILHPPGGVAGGDDLEVRAHVGPGAHALITTPAAGKFYRRGAAGGARLAQHLCVDGGILEWLPQENLFHPGAVARLSNVVRLSAGARFLGWEISCLGMPARGLSLESGALFQGFELWLGERPLLLERLALDQICAAAGWGLGGSAVLGTFLAHPAMPPDLERARAAAASCAGITVACTLVDGVLACRALGARADLVRLAFTGLWRALRPALLGREAVAPRIWST
jgi:urease accessory protein